MGEAPAPVETPASPEAEAKPAAPETPTAAGKADEELDAKTLANRKKKDKKKAKQNAAMGGDGMWGNDDKDEENKDTPAEKEEAPAPAPAPKKGGKPEKKETAAMKAIREKMEAQRKLEEE